MYLLPIGLRLMIVGLALIFGLVTLQSIRQRRLGNLRVSLISTFLQYCWEMFKTTALRRIQVGGLSAWNTMKYELEALGAQRHSKPS